MTLMNTIRRECSKLINVGFLGAKGHSSLFTYKRKTQHIAPKTTNRCLSTRAPATGRLKREDVRHTNFDSAFSKWKPLSGPFDREDYSMGKGAERYTTQNLPKLPGLYEFGIRCKFSSRVIVVYVGQSQNLRARLPQYGRNGAHLEYRLFSDVFSKGHTIVYRCATMNSKRCAEEIEGNLLRIYDYAWNKRCNGDRRPDDIHKRLESPARKSDFSSLVNTIRRYFDQIKTRDPFIPPNIQKNPAIECLGIKGILSMISGTRKKCPRQIVSNEKCSTSNICGAATTGCARPPIDGRKRCAEHKSNNIGLESKFRREEKALKPNYNTSEHHEKFCYKLWRCILGSGSCESMRCRRK